MKKFCIFMVILAFAGSVFAQHNHGGGKPAPKKNVPLYTGLGNYQHPVSTKVSAAQKFFDQGLMLVFAFNHEEAIRSFQRAAELDPQLAMAHWGIALATGPNYNETEVDANREKTAYEHIQKALALASTASESEKDYINALAKRFSANPKADFKKHASDYREAMKALMQKYPDDPDAACLYAESIMTPIAWKLYDGDKQPQPGTEEAVNVLESVLSRDPNHVMANHLYIHATEGSTHPERAIPSADRLTMLVPAAGHLVHMPAHTYDRVGFYDKAAQSNRDGIKADEAYFKATGNEGMYKVMYFQHNVHFLAFADSTQGRYGEARQNIDKLAAAVSPMVKDVPMAEMFLPGQFYILVHFQKWSDILKMQEPPKSALLTDALWRWARAMALVSNHKTQEAEAERAAMQQIVASMKPDYLVGYNKGSDLAAVAQHLIDSEISLAKQDRKGAIDSLRKAVQTEDRLMYSEPADWFFSVRPTLGAMVLLDGNAKEAEQIFREDLARKPRNGRALFGLKEALKAQGRDTEAYWVEKELATAWKNADTKLTLDNL
jgi:tetratricopeptide (TPR) repeat protein